MNYYQANLNANSSQVNRVIRIHNRYLRSRFDQRVQELIDDGACEKAKSKKAFEYLFYGEVPLLCQRAKGENELLRIAEVSFPGAKVLCFLMFSDL